MHNTILFRTFGDPQLAGFITEMENKLRIKITHGSHIDTVMDNASLTRDITTGFDTVIFLFTTRDMSYHIAEYVRFLTRVVDELILMQVEVTTDSIKLVTFS